MRPPTLPGSPVGSRPLPTVAPETHTPVVLAPDRSPARQSVDQALWFYDEQTPEELGWGARPMRHDLATPLVLRVGEDGMPKAHRRRPE